MMWFKVELWQNGCCCCVFLVFKTDATGSTIIGYNEYFCHVCLECVTQALEQGLKA